MEYEDLVALVAALLVNGRAIRGTTIEKAVMQDCIKQAKILVGLSRES